MASKSGYKLLKKTNEDDSDFSTSKPGPSSETQAEDENDKQGRIVSGPGILEPSKVESLSFDERSKKKWTRSCPRISTTEEPIGTSGSSNDRGSDLQWSGSVGDYNQQRQDGGEGDDNQQQHLDGGEGDDNQQQHLDGGEGDENQQHLLDGGEPHTSRFKAFKKSYFSCANSITKSRAIYGFQAICSFFAVSNIALGITSLGHCRNLSGKKESQDTFSLMTTTVGVSAFILIFCWGCVECCKRSSCCSKCVRIFEEGCFWFLFSLSLLSAFFEFVFYFLVKCEEPYNVWAQIMLVLNGIALIIAIVTYFPIICCPPRRRVRVMPGHNGYCRHPGSDEDDDEV